MSRTLAPLILFLLTAVCSAQNIIHAQLGQRLNDTVLRHSYGQFWGSVLVSKDSEVLLAHGYALANRDLHPISAHSLLELASISKAFTAAAIFRLESQNNLKVSDALSLHLPDVPTDKHAITIHHLLTHTSGLGQPPIRFTEDSRDQVIAAMLRAPVKSAPGSAFEYSNAGYWLLAAIIERASGLSYEQYLREHVLTPAGMASTFAQTDPKGDMTRCVDRVLKSKRVGSAGECPYPFTWGYRGSGGIVTSARDMFAWDQSLRADTLLSADAKARMFQPMLDDYACGWIIRDTPLGRTASHTGAVAGFVASFTRWLDRDACVLVITNAPHDPVALSDALTRILFPESVESVKAVMRPSMYPLGEHGQATMPASTLWRITRAPASVHITFHGSTESDAALALELNPALAARVSEELRRHAAAVLAHKQVSPNPPVVVELYTSAYKDTPEPIRIEGDDVVLVVRPGTPHPEEGGEHRVTIIIQDPAHGFWPVFIKLAADEARKLGEQLLVQP